MPSSPVCTLFAFFRFNSVTQHDPSAVSMRRSHADYRSLKKSGTKIPRRFADLSAKIKLAFYPLGGLKDGRRCGKIDIYSVFCHHGKDCGAANRKTETGANAVRVLFVGDVVSEIGCDFLIRTMPQMKKKHNIDFCIVNGENSALGNSIIWYYSIE